MAEVNAGLPDGAHFALRVGVNTGEVLAGAVGDAYTVVGDTVNVASRLQSAARPGSVTVGERTMRATDAAVEYTALEPLELKGKAEPRARLGGGRADRRALRAARGAGARVAARGPPAGARRARQPLRARGARGHLAPGDGRGRGGRGQVAPAARVRARGWPQHPSTPTVRTGRCLPYGSGIVFWALGEVLRAECGIVESDSSEEAWQQAARLRGRPDGRRRARHSDREAALIGRLLGVDVPPELVPEEDDPERMREAFLAALRRGIEAIAHAAPVRDRLRGHPLGRRRHARRDRAPRAVGARAADARLPGARRAARPAPELGRRPALRHAADARAR